ncbi:MAG: single-stranded-DNA-specific exonuclease RecJ [Alphaproteobacteria bacterium]|nr:single-stranded-DNA-specific exonuclease RecJ [Alphaproteobacteria bacterium]
MDSNVSLGGNIWKLPQVDEGLCARIAETYHLSPSVAKILALRGVGVAEAEDFLNPKIQKLMPDPNVMKDAAKAAERIADAVEKHEQIAIIGDYDVDGATSTSVLTRFFRQVGIEPLIHIPSREEGYGPSDLAFEEFKAGGATLVLTIDCGTTAFDVLNKAAANFDIIVIDHHEAEIKLPQVFAVVNPKRLDDDNPYTYLQYMSAVGVGFMVLVAVNRVLRQRGFYQDRTEPDLMQLLDLVALGTVCDVVPLLYLNRAYVKQGLKIMAKQQNIGLKHLMQVLNMQEAPTAYHLGYTIGPRINACGRVGDARLGSKLLCSDNDLEAQMLAEQFNQFNMERKEIENFVLLSAIEQVEGQPQEYPMAFVYGEDWHQGVIGIVAGKLRERYNMPAFVMSIEPDEVKGSARSIDGIDLGALIMTAKEKGVITGGGGHIMAAGFSLSKEQIPAFQKFVGEYILQHLGDEKVVPVLDVDSVLNLSAVNEKLADDLSLLEPYGTGNAEPLIMLQNVRVMYPQAVGTGGHIRCTLQSTLGDKVSAIAFRVADSEIGYAMLNNRGELFDAVGYVRCDSWQGKKRVQFMINDLMRKT